MHAEFQVDAGQVRFDGALADVQQFTDRSCAHALHGERRDLPLAPGERPGPGRRRGGPLARFTEVTERLERLVTPPAAAYPEYLDRLAQPLDRCFPILRHEAAPRQSKAARPKGLVAATEE